MNIFLYICASIVIAIFFDIKSGALISFYSSVLPFVFALIVGIKAITFNINKDDYDDEVSIKDDINCMSKEIFDNLVRFFAISLIIFIMMTFSIDYENALISEILSREFIKNYASQCSYVFLLLFETCIIMSFIYFVIIILNIKTIISEILRLNDLKNKK